MEDNQNNDIDVKPIVSLPEVVIPTNEENEKEMIKLRARLFRFRDGEWKERGTGEIKLLHNEENHAIRVVMRRDKTLKICANHFLTPDIELQKHINSDRDFNYSCFADFTDGQPQSELFALRFATVENAQLWKNKVEEAKLILKTKCSIYAEEFLKSSDADTDSSSEDDLGSSDKPSTEENAENVIEDIQKLKIEN